MSNHSGSGLAKFIAKLERRSSLSVRARDAIAKLPTETRTYDAHQYIVAEDDKRTSCAMIESGLASRAKTLLDGTRQIVAFAIPGDMIDLQSLLLPMADFSVVTQTRVMLKTVLHADLRRAMALSAEIVEALWRDTLVDEAIRDVWVVSNCGTQERARLSHLLLEFQSRFAAGIDGNTGRFRLPLTHLCLGEALGLSAAQVGHAFSSLQDDGLLSIDAGWIGITQRDELQKISGFTSGYLHLD